MKADAALGALRDRLGAADYCLTETVYEAVCAFAAVGSDAWIAGKTPEFGGGEFLVNVDGTGRAVGMADGVAKDLRTRPGLNGWLFERDGAPAVARWLAHLAGFRHRCVHLFLDPPAMPGATLVQVRSFAKYNAPGCVDMPVAGHIKAGHRPADGLREELREELGLALGDDVTGLRKLGTHAMALVPTASLPDCYDVEHATVYGAKLAPEAWNRLRFADGEVAALALFRVSELAVLLRDFPERAGGGLRDSFPFYERG